MATTPAETAKRIVEIITPLIKAEYAASESRIIAHFDERLAQTERNIVNLNDERVTQLISLRNRIEDIAALVESKKTKPKKATDTAETQAQAQADGQPAPEGEAAAKAAADTKAGGVVRKTIGTWFKDAWIADPKFGPRYCTEAEIKLFEVDQTVKSRKKEDTRLQALATLAFNHLRTNKSDHFNKVIVPEYEKWKREANGKTEKQVEKEPQTP